MYQHGLSTILDRSRLRAKLRAPCMVASFDRVTRLNRMYGGYVRQPTYANILYDNVTGSICQCGRGRGVQFCGRYFYMGCPIFWTVSTVCWCCVIYEPITYIMLSRKTAKIPITNVMLSRRGVQYNRHFLRARHVYIVYYPKLLYVWYIFHLHLIHIRGCLYRM